MGETFRGGLSRRSLLASGAAAAGLGVIGTGSLGIRPAFAAMDWKRHAGAAHLTRMRSARLVRRLPKSLACDLVPPALQLKRSALYLMPDVVLVEDGSGYAAVSYDAIATHWEARPFVESGVVPSDCDVVDQSWAHPNKDGGPDRRFAGNRRLPVCLLGVLHIASAGRFDLLLRISNITPIESLVAAMRAMLSQAMAATGEGAQAVSAPSLPAVAPRNDAKSSGTMFDTMLASAAASAAASLHKRLPPPDGADAGDRS